MFKKDPKLGNGTSLSYEEKYGILIENIKQLLKDEESTAKLGTNDLPKTIYALEHPVYSLFATIFANAFIEEQRKEIDKILDNPLRAQYVKRIRTECLSVITVCGMDFVRQLTDNIVDGVVHMSGTTGKTSRALREELGTYFAKRPILWYCVAAGSVYASAMIENSKGIAAKLILEGLRPKNQTGA